MTLGSDRETIMCSLQQKLIEINNNSLLKEGQNIIRTTINGVENVQINCFIKEGILLSVDAYISEFKRIYGNFIDLGIK